MAKKSLYDILGVKKDADKKTIKDAYRDKAKKSHPDAGGDKEEFQDISHAYAVLICPIKKERYDTTGRDKPESDFETKFMGIINSIFMQIVSANDIDTSDLVGEFKKHLNKQKKSFFDQKESCKLKIIMLQRVDVRLKSKGNKTIVDVLNGHIEEMKRALISLDNEIEFLDKVIHVMEDYGYDFDKVQEDGSKNTFHWFNMATDPIEEEGTGSYWFSPSGKGEEPDIEAALEFIKNNRRKG